MNGRETKERGKVRTFGKYRKLVREIDTNRKRKKQICQVTKVENGELRKDQRTMRSKWREYRLQYEKRKEI